MTRERFPRLAADQMSALQREVAAEIAAGPRGEVRGPFVALIHHPELARRIQQLGEQLRWKSSLPPRLLEMAVLMTARRWTCQHEWFIHAKLARDAGLSEALIQEIAAGTEPAAMPDEEKAVYAFCREAHATGRVGDAAFANVETRFGKPGALDLLALCGYYSMMAMVLNSAGMPLPGNAAPPLK